MDSTNLIIGIGFTVFFLLFIFRCVVVMRQANKDLWNLVNDLEDVIKGK